MRFPHLSSKVVFKVPKTQLCRYYRTMEQHKPVANNTELNERLAKLPAYSQTVYTAIKAGLYAEPFFSDVTVEDIATATTSTTTAVRGALKHLIEQGLVYTEQYDANRSKRIFLHTYEHDNYNVI